MDTTELGFNAWVLIPNVLSTFRREIEEASTGNNSPQRLWVIAMQDRLEPLNPDGMLNALAHLPDKDRATLLAACERIYNQLGDASEGSLGLPIDAARGVFQFLRSCATVH